MCELSSNYPNKPSILIVDDEEAIRKMISKGIAKNYFNCSTADDANHALSVLDENEIDVVLTDIGLPGMNGIELNRIIQKEYSADVIVMTGAVDEYAYDKVISEGATDFLKKPVQINEIILRINRILRERESKKKLKESLESHRKTIDAIVQTMAASLEVRDPYTAGHQRRVAELAVAIAKELNMSKDQIDQIYMAGVIHDIGKIAVPSEILSKPTRLTEFEFGIVKSHPKVAYDLLKNIEFPWPIDQIIYQHHEKIDGSGYPQGLKGDEISIEARIISIADVVEAIASHRPYRPSLGVKTALDEISNNKQIKYDQKVVEACIRIIKNGKVDLNNMM